MILNESDCLHERKWYYFLCSSLLSFFLAMFIVLVYYAIENRWFSKDKAFVEHSSYSNAVRVWCEQIILKQHIKGKILDVIYFFFNLGSYIIFVIDAQYGNNEICIIGTDYIRHLIDFVFNMYYLFFFIIRVLATNHKFKALLTPNSAVDYVTIAPSILTLILSRSWIGLRFLRVGFLMQLPAVLHSVSIVYNIRILKITRLICYLFTLLMIAGGLIFSIESGGDPFGSENPNDNMNFWISLYYIVLTIATLGYGDYVCTTTLGRAATIMLVCIAILFSKHLVQLITLIGDRGKSCYQHESYDEAKRHIVICGHITYQNITNFLNDFFHEDRQHDVEIVILDDKKPDAKLKGLLQRHSGILSFFNGCSFHTTDLKRVKLAEADCCLIFANKYSLNPDSEDAANIMRVISIKKHASVRVIIQLILNRNQIFLCNIPNWDFAKGDDMITLSELKLGFIAQSCLAPGFSTLMTNLVSMRSFKNLSEIPKSTEDYLRGSRMSIYNIKLSNAFFKMTFLDAALLCFNKLEITLIALEIDQKDFDLNNIILINPINTVIKPNTNGFFIAETFDIVKRARIYCKVCHKKITDARLIRICRCTLNAAAAYINELGDLCLDYRSHRAYQADKINERVLPKVEINIETYIKLKVKVNKKRETQTSDTQITRSHQHVSRQNKAKAAKSGIRIPNTALGIKKSDITYQEIVQTDQKELEPTTVIKEDQELPNSSRRNRNSSPIADSNSLENELEFGFDNTGLYYWCEAKNLDDCFLLDDNNIPKINLNNHIIVCAIADANSLIGLRNLILPLRASNLLYQKLKYIVIIGSIEYIRNEWEMIAHFPKIQIVNGSPLNRADLRKANIDSCFMCCILTGKNPGTRVTSLSDKEAIIASLNIKSMNSGVDRYFSSENLTNFSSFVLKSTGNPIPLITELMKDRNVQYLDQDDDDQPETELYLTQPFACGNVFSVSCLDAVISTTYFNQSVYNLVRKLITGSTIRDLELICDEDNSTSTINSINSLNLRNRSSISQISLADPAYDRLLEYSYSTYNKLFKKSLQMYGMLCLGLYRLRDGQSKNKRYVITNPPNDFILRRSDKVYVLLQFSSRKTIIK